MIRGWSTGKMKRSVDVTSHRPNQKKPPGKISPRGRYHSGCSSGDAALFGGPSVVVLAACRSISPVVSDPARSAFPAGVHAGLRIDRTGGEAAVRNLAAYPEPTIACVSPHRIVPSVDLGVRYVLF